MHDPAVHLGEVISTSILSSAQVFTYRRSEGSPSHLSCVFVSETHFVCGAEDGTLSVVDTRNTE